MSEIAFILVSAGLLACWAFGMSLADRPKKIHNLMSPEQRADTLNSVIEFRKFADEFERLGDHHKAADCRNSAGVLERMVEQCDRGELGGESLGWALGKIASQK